MVKKKATDGQYVKKETTLVVAFVALIVGFPRGPAKSRILSPLSNCESMWVVFPTTWKTMVTVPSLGSESTMVRGMRSPLSSTRRMTNWPGLRFLAISGAMTLSLTIWGVRTSFSAISGIQLSLLLTLINSQISAHTFTRIMQDNKNLICQVRQALLLSFAYEKNAIGCSKVGKKFNDISAFFVMICVNRHFSQDREASFP